MVNRPKSDLEMEEVFLPVLASSSSTAAVPTDLDHKKLPPENSGLNLKVSSPEEPQEVVRLQLYKRRWAGLVIIVEFLFMFLFVLLRGGMEQGLICDSFLLFLSSY